MPVSLATRDIVTESSPCSAASSRSCPGSPLAPLWLEAGYTGQEHRGIGWVEKNLRWSAQIVRPPKKLAPEEVMWAWVRGLNKEGVPVDPKRFRPEQGPRPFLPRSPRWRGLSLVAISEQEDEPMDYERLPESSEAFIYVAMSRLMARRLARS